MRLFVEEKKGEKKEKKKYFVGSLKNL